MKTLRAVEYEVPHLGRYVVSYKGEVLNSDVTGAELFDYALDHGFTHVELDRTQHGVRKVKAYRQSERMD